MVRISILIIVALLALPHAMADWPMDGADPGRSNAVAGPGPFTSLGTTPLLDGFVETPFAASSKDDKLFVGGLTGGPFDVYSGRKAVALDLDTLDVIWETTLIPEDTPYLDANHRLGPPVIEDGHVVIQASTGRLWTLNTTTGNIVWETTLPGGIPGHTIYSTERGPAVANGRIHAVIDTNPNTEEVEMSLRTYDLKTGAVLWTSDVDSISHIAVVQDLVVVYNGALVALNAATGILAWQYNLPSAGLTGYSGDGPVARGDRILLHQHAFRQGASGHEQAYRLHAVDTNGVLRWSHSTPWHTPTEPLPRLASPAVTQDYAIAHMGNNLLALDLETGAVGWSREVGPSMGRPAVAGKEILATVATDDDQNQVLALHVDSGMHLWSGPRITGIHDVLIHGDHVLLHGTSWGPGSVQGRGILILHEDDTPPAWTEEAPLRAHQQSHAWRLTWSAPEDLNMAEIQIQSSNSTQGPWTTVATTHPRDRGNGGLYDPYLSYEVKSGGPDHYRVLAVDAAGNVGPPSNVWTRMGDGPNAGGGSDAGAFGAGFSPNPVGAGDIAKAQASMGISDRAVPDEAEAVFSRDTGTGTETLRVPLVVHASGSGWYANGSRLFQAPENEGHYKYHVLFQARYDDAWAMFDEMEQLLSVSTNTHSTHTTGTMTATHTHTSSASPRETVTFNGRIGFSDTNPEAGSTVEVFIPVINSGEVQATGTVQLRELNNDKLVVDDVVRLEPGEKATLRGLFTPPEAGEYILEASLYSEGSPEVQRVPLQAGDSGSQGPALVLSAGLTNIANLAAGESRVIPLEVTAYHHDAMDVELVVLDNAGLTVRPLTPAATIPAGQTIKFYLEVEGNELARNASVESRRLMIQAESLTGVSNVEVLEVITTKPGFLGIPGLGPGGAAAAVGASGLLAAAFRRRH